MENNEIVELIRSGDKEVIKSVYKENAKDIYNFSKSIIGDHDLSMDVTKRTFVKLFSGIQNGDEPANIRLAALKVAYDEACKIALPSSENIDSPYDRDEREEPAAEAVVEETKADEPEATEAVAESEEAEPAETKPAETEPEVAESEEPAEEEPKEPVWVEVEQETEEEPAPVFDESVAAPVAAIFGEKAPAEEVVPTGEGYSFVMAEEKADPNSTQVIDISVQDDSEADEEKSEDDEDYEDEKPKKKKGVTTVLIIVNIILVLILLWLVYGLLENFGVLPDNLCFDLGYTWFNETIYPIF